MQTQPLRTPTASAVAAKYPVCRARDLVPQPVLVAPMGMDQVAFRVRLSNHGPACSLRGHPNHLSGTTLTGHVRRLAVGPDSVEDEQALTSRRPAQLATGGAAEFVLHAGYSCVHPQTREHAGQTYRRLRFGFPHGRSRISVAFPARASDPKTAGMWLPACSTSVTRIYAAIPLRQLIREPSASPSVTDPAAGTGCTTKAWPSPTPILDMQFVGGTGWAVGAAGILTTSDGGAHWTVRLHTARRDLGRVDFVDAEHGWVVGASQLLVTRDGGTTWHQLPQPRCRAIRMVHFVSPTRGFAVAGGSTHGMPGALPGTGGVLLATSDAGRSWTRLPTPPDAQSVCFQDAHTGWVGTRRGIYASTDGGRRWHRIMAAPGGWRGARPTVDVRCRGRGSAWALASGFGAASSQMPHIGWRLTTTSATPLFAEQYFPHPAVHVTRRSASAYPGPFSPIDASTAAFLDYCPACGGGTVPWLIASADGQLQRRGNVAGLTTVTAAAFTTTNTGCAAGQHDRRRRGRTTTAVVARIVCTNDEGKHWTVTWEQPLPRG